MTSNIILQRTPQPEKRYYCYALWYPQGYIQDGTDLGGYALYCGKGTTAGNDRIERVDSHEREARISALIGKCPCYKCRVIRRIWASGLQVQKSIVYETDIECDALQYEWACINLLYLSPYLTNSSDNIYAIDRKRQEKEQFWQDLRRRMADGYKRTYEVSPESQSVLLSIAEQDGVAPLEALERLIKSCSIQETIV